VCATTTSRIRIIRKEKRRRKASEDDVIDAKSGLVFLFLYEMIDYETKLLWIKRRDAYRYVNSVYGSSLCVSFLFASSGSEKRADEHDPKSAGKHATSFPSIQHADADADAKEKKKKGVEQLRFCLLALHRNSPIISPQIPQTKDLDQT
jgi:hypothetical protein